MRTRTRRARPIRAAAIVVPALVMTLLGGACSPPAFAASATPPCTAGVGPYQRRLEQHLGLRADGRQSPADCAAIRAFQERNGVRPAAGYAGPITHHALLVVEARADPDPARRCPARSARVACVDLGRRLMWVQEGRRVVHPAVPVRAGRDGYETRSGWHRVYRRSIDHRSTLYANAPMPYAQFFSRGQAFHGYSGDILRGGSHGCVNLRLADARRLWDTLRKGDQVYVWGRAPGT